MDFEGAIEGIKDLRAVYYKPGGVYQQTTAVKVRNQKLFLTLRRE